MRDLVALLQNMVAISNVNDSVDNNFDNLIESGVGMLLQNKRRLLMCNLIRNNATKSTLGCLNNKSGCHKQPL